MNYAVAIIGFNNTRSKYVLGLYVNAEDTKHAALGLAASAFMEENPEFSIEQTVMVPIHNERRTEPASGIEGEAGDAQRLHPEGESPVGEAETPNA